MAVYDRVSICRVRAGVLTCSRRGAGWMSRALRRYWGLRGEWRTPAGNKVGGLWSIPPRSSHSDPRDPGISLAVVLAPLEPAGLQGQHEALRGRATADRRAPAGGSGGAPNRLVCAPQRQEPECSVSSDSSRGIRTKLSCYNRRVSSRLQSNPSSGLRVRHASPTATRHDQPEPL